LIESAYIDSQMCKRFNRYPQLSEILFGYFKLCPDSIENNRPENDVVNILYRNFLEFFELQNISLKMRNSMNNSSKIYIVICDKYAHISFEYVLNLKLFQLNVAKRMVYLCEIKFLFYICIEHRISKLLNPSSSFFLF